MQPWLMRIGGKKDGKHYRGQREGAVSENTTFYVFTHAPDGSFEAHPIKEWYNFVPRVSENKQSLEQEHRLLFLYHYFGKFSWWYITSFSGIFFLLPCRFVYEMSVESPHGVT